MKKPSNSVSAGLLPIVLLTACNLDINRDRIAAQTGDRKHTSRQQPNTERGKRLKAIRLRQKQDREARRARVAKRREARELRRKLRKMGCPTLREVEKRLAQMLKYAEEHPELSLHNEDVYGKYLKLVTLSPHPKGGGSMLSDNFYRNLTNIHISPSEKELTFGQMTMGGSCTYKGSKRNLEADAKRALQIHRKQIKFEKGKKDKKK